MQMIQKEDPADRRGVSGLTKFDGEDIYAEERRIMQEIQQKEWHTQQMEENALKRRMAEASDKRYEEQARAFAEMRNQQEDTQGAKHKEMEDAVREQNLQMLREKKEREAREREYDLYLNAKHSEYNDNSDLMTENPAAAASAMSATRVRKDHWKGMSAEQKQDILNTMKMQIYEKKKQKEMEEEADKLWIAQEERKRLLVLKQMHEQKRREKEMDDALKEKLKAQANAHKAMWTNYYGEKLGFDKPSA
eukprot:TRINITY_DN12080_c0_g1_i10.p1 TRINITY_DN12080_c0_g1~~TRINITY_DN12080_c0_g1_i10.p1  ORF type:complete len:249 (+),score=89.12 TRINITY_DN12080_c0_g1_i10:63-809(+)